MEVISEMSGERVPLNEPGSTDVITSGEPISLKIGCVGGGSDPTVVSAWVNDGPVLSVAIDHGLDSFTGVGFWLGGDGVEFRIDDVVATSERIDPPSPRFRRSRFHNPGISIQT